VTRAVLEPPLSKSDAQRALVLAHALDWPELGAAACAGGAALPLDVERVRAGLSALRRSVDGRAEIDCGDGAAPLRFMVAQAAVTRGSRVRFTGSGRLGERPHGALFDALERALGPAGLVLSRGAPWPVEVRGAGRAPEAVFRVGARESSQYASSLVLAAAALARAERRAWRVELEGPLTSGGYLALTLGWARRCGVAVARRGSTLVVPPGEHPASVPEVPADWSSLAYLLLIAWRSGSEVRRVPLRAEHPDSAIVAHLASIGLTLVRSGTGAVCVEGCPRGGLRASASVTPDLVPTLAALACALERPSVFTDVELLRGKESDRLEGTAALVRAAGGEARLVRGALVVEPPAAPAQVLAFSPRGDHRMAMAAATLAVLLGSRLELDAPDCVAKSFPGFWDQLARVGARAA